MRKIILTILVMGGYFCVAQTTDYEKAWRALNENKRTEAQNFLSSARSDNARSLDAFITQVYLKTYNGKESEVTDFGDLLYAKTPNPYPYIYALWFNDAVLGDYGKKDFDHQVKLMDRLIGDEKAPGSLVAAAGYQKGMHLLFGNDIEKAGKFFSAVGNIQNWQYVGPFENLSESGFYKNYGPLEHPEPSAVFKSITNADISWFTPAAENKSGWTPMIYPINRQTAVSYAQTFVNSAADMEVYCNAGTSGSLKVWLNDELLVAEPKERVTEMDLYTVKCNLKKGTNRLLVQLGYTGFSYPNFNIRFTDDKFRAIPGLSGSPVYAAYPKMTGKENKYILVPHFAEKFFKEKISSEPGNLVNYLLLSDVYLRAKKVTEARSLLDTIMTQFPGNSIVRMKLAEVLTKDNNRTQLLEEVEKIKKADPESLLAMDLDIKELFENEKFDDGSQLLEKRIRIHGEDASTASYRIQVLLNEKKYEELVREAERMYQKYPNNAKLLDMMYVIKKEVYKDKKGAIKIYERFLKNNYSYDVYTTYSKLLSEDGNESKAVDIKEMLTEYFPYDPGGFNNLSAYYYGIKKYDKAEDYIRKALAIAPYNEDYWKQLGDIKSEKKEKAGAMEAYNKSLQYDPNQYEVINQIRKLNNKQEFYKYFPEADVPKIIKADDQSKAKNTDYGYYYIHDQKDVIFYPEGATEEYSTIVIKITNEKGVDRYKESSIGYGSTQNLLIEKAEVIKKNQTRLEGERDGNQIVFTNLEVGDVLVFKYRTQSFVYGRFSKEFWDKYYFGGQIYSATTRYNFLAPASLKLYYEFRNSDIQPVIKDIENFKMYSWEMINPVPVKDEPLQPVLADVGTVLHLSTIPSWKEIASWYSDISSNKAEEDIEVINLHKKLFPDPKKDLSQFQKARIIYDYIEANIRYSSTPFRQSAYVPQRAAKTINTRLGDCKDLSSLFVTLTHMSGIQSQMVLVNTRDNGQKEILLPGVEFNHCIAKATLDNKPYYIELTDNYLPFASLPNNLNGAAVLEIPSKSVGEQTTLQLLKTATRTKDAVKRVLDIKPQGEDLEVSVKAVKYGNLTSHERYTYGSLDSEKQMQEMEKAVAGNYKNGVKLQQVNFKEIDKLNDSLVYNYSFKVKNEITEIGALQTFQINYPDVVASIDNFSADERFTPVDYWRYENTDTYETVVNITAPAGKKFAEVPKNETLVFKEMKFSITYNLKAPDKLVVTRKFSNNRENVPVADYQAFKDFFVKILKAEKRIIAFK